MVYHIDVNRQTALVANSFSTQSFECKQLPGVQAGSAQWETALGMGRHQPERPFTL